ncbi:MAG: hypothetical protein NTW86_04465 [Candidatus Sumerlaeota bacterium]|nr:hypothetical protein [Candidatus Sumerlaeota bacterium]
MSIPSRLLVLTCLASLFALTATAFADRTIPVILIVPAYGDRQTVIDAWNGGLGKEFDLVADAPLKDNFEDWAGIKVGQFAWTTPSFAAAQATAERAPASVKWIIYDFEHWKDTPQAEQDDVAGTSRRLRAFADARRWKTAFIPMNRDGLKLAASLAPYYDAYLVQCQKYQTDAKRAATVDMLRQVEVAVHGANPKCLAGCQLGTLDEYGDGSADSGVKAALATYAATKNFLQIYCVWWPPDGKQMARFLKAIDSSEAAEPKPPGR